MSATPALSLGERLDRLRLIRSENVGPITFFELLSRYGRAGDAIAALPELARRAGRTNPLRVPTRAAAEAELDKIQTLGGRLLCHDEPAYPSALAATEGAPPILFLRGRVELLARRMIGVVGARNASTNGRRFARQLAAELGEAGLVVVSGLARGIDASAHEGALASGTVAAMAGGVDIVYPEENRSLYAGIIELGAAVSEMPPGLEPKARHFPRRNRIVSGLSLGVVVVEAAARSGSLITARLALEQGREVFAVPGSPLDPRCKGTNGLIREGAILTESAADVLAALDGPLRRPLREGPAAPPALPAEASESDLARARVQVLECLGPDPAPVDEILRQCHLPPSVVSMVLLDFELAGRIERHPGHRVSLLS